MRPCRSLGYCCPGLVSPLSLSPTAPQYVGSGVPVERQLVGIVTWDSRIRLPSNDFGLLDTLLIFFFIVLGRVCFNFLYESIFAQHQETEGGDIVFLITNSYLRVLMGGIVIMITIKFGSENE